MKIIPVDFTSQMMTVLTLWCVFNSQLVWYKASLSSPHTVFTTVQRQVKPDVLLEAFPVNNRHFLSPLLFIEHAKRLLVLSRSVGKVAIMRSGVITKRSINKYKRISALYTAESLFWNQASAKLLLFKLSFDDNSIKTPKILAL